MGIYIFFEGLLCYMYVMYISIFVHELFQSPSAWSQHSDDINMVSYVCMYVCRYVCRYVGMYVCMCDVWACAADVCLTIYSSISINKYGILSSFLLALLIL